MKAISILRATALALLLPSTARASDAPAIILHWVGTPVAWLAVAIFVLAYALVVFEEKIHMRKSKPVMVGAALIWMLIAWQAARTPGVGGEVAASAFRQVFLEFAELFFFLVVAMSFVAAMTERNVFESLRAELVKRDLSFRKLFWITGLIAFFMSAVLDNLTTALIMSAVILAVAAGNRRFISLAFINLVVAANAGGAWCAFGDITTLMAWNADKAKFFEFFDLFVPSVVNWIVPGLCMHFALPRGAPPRGVDDADIKYGGLAICAFFALTIALTVLAKYFLHMPAVFGMMLGLGLLKLMGYHIKMRDARRADPLGEAQHYNVFRIIAAAEWDTLLFFYGVLLCVGGLATIGYMELASTQLYGEWGHTWANVAMGTASAVVDNIPIMYAVLQMNPPMDHGQWLLITLTCGVGGSMLSVGSAAGVALMGQSKGLYTFFSHLRWSWAVALGYVLSIAVHLWWNGDLFTNGIWH
jgi:Na+/H+ antiporter NhaD/arsenite permease-like protein